VKVKVRGRARVSVKPLVAFPYPPPPPKPRTIYLQKSPRMRLWRSWYEQEPTKLEVA
jgi:hypothetical protein